MRLLYFENRRSLEALLGIFHKQDVGDGFVTG